MRILAFDTSTLAQAVAIVEGAHVLFEASHRVERGHTSTLLRRVDEALERTGLALADLDLIAVGLGPGSFTGLRIGVASAKALAYACGVKVVGASSLAAMAHWRDVPADTLIVTANDARKRELYAAIWRPVPGAEREPPEAVVAPATFTAAALSEAIARQPLPAVGLGNGFALYPRELHNGLGQGLAIWPEEAGRPSAAALADLGRRAFERDGPADLVALEPRYIRKSDAELNWNRD